MIKNMKKLWRHTNRWHIVLFMFLIAELQLLPRRQYGFHCNDPKLSYSFNGDTISMKWLFGLTLFLPIVVMLVTEKVNNLNQGTNNDTRNHELQWYKEYLFGLLINVTIVQVVKSLVGSPRPHFFDTCAPEEALHCKGSEFVSSYTCTKSHWLSQSDKSFPSGHTSLAVHAGVFVTYYLLKRTSKPHHKTVIATQSLCMLLTFFCAVSRLYDRRHHYWDVMTGLVLALPILYYIIIKKCHDFKVSSTTSPEDQRKSS